MSRSHSGNVNEFMKKQFEIQKKHAQSIVNGFLIRIRNECSLTIPKDVIGIILKFFCVYVDLWDKCGTKVNISSDKRTIWHNPNDDTSWDSAIGTIVADINKGGIHEWKLKMDFCSIRK